MKNGAGNGTFSVKFVFHNIFVHIYFELKRNKNTVKYQIFKKNKIALTEGTFAATILPTGI